jgi:hypothetical protein
MWLDQGSSREIRRMPKPGAESVCLPVDQGPESLSVRFKRLNADLDRKDNVAGRASAKGAYARVKEHPQHLWLPVLSSAT